MLAKSPEVWAYSEHLGQLYSDQMERAKSGPLLLHLQLRCYQKGHGNLSLSVLLKRKTKVNFDMNDWIQGYRSSEHGTESINFQLFIYWRSVCITCSLLIIIQCNSWGLLINCYSNQIRVSSFLMTGESTRLPREKPLGGQHWDLWFWPFLDSFLGEF